MVHNLTMKDIARFSTLLADEVFGKVKSSRLKRNRELVHAAVMEKNWMWHNDFKIPNGVHVFGRRYNPFGPDNYPAELTKIREMTAIRDDGNLAGGKRRKNGSCCSRCKKHLSFRR